jgi:hypothetical protein
MDVERLAAWHRAALPLALSFRRGRRGPQGDAPRAPEEGPLLVSDPQRDRLLAPLVATLNHPLPSDALQRTDAFSRQAAAASSRHERCSTAAAHGETPRKSVVCTSSFGHF